MNNIATKQNDAKFISFLKAQRIAYSRCKNYQVFDTVSIIIAIMTPIIGFTTPKILNIITVIGVIWTILYLALDNIRKNKSSLGAKIQEQFDTELFKIKWNSILCKEKINIDTISDLALKYKKNDLFDWYSVEITPDLNSALAIILCQRISLSWENALKTKYATILLWSVIIFYSIIIATSLIINYGIFDTFLLISPTIPFLVYGVQNFLTIKSQKENRERLITEIDNLLDTYKNTRNLPDENIIRNIQDVIYNERTTIEKTPDWFYRLFKQKFEDRTDEIIRNIKSEL